MSTTVAARRRTFRALADGARRAVSSETSTRGYWIAVRRCALLPWTSDARLPTGVGHLLRARRGPAHCRAGHAHPDAVPVVDAEAPVAGDPDHHRARHGLAAAADVRPLHLRPRGRRGHRPGRRRRHLEVGRAAARGDADGCPVRHPDAHLHRPHLADRPLRDDEAGHPQGRADGPRPPPAYADRRGAERRLQRLRRVRRADRDPGPHLHPAGRLPRGGLHRAEHLGRARRAAADRGAGAGRRGLPAAQAAPPSSGGRARPQLRPDLPGHRHRRRACGSCAASAASAPSAATTPPSPSSPARPASRPASGRRRSRPSACCSPACSSCCWCGSAPAR